MSLLTELTHVEPVPARPLQPPAPLLEGWSAVKASAERRTLASVTILAWAVRGAAAINFIAFTLHHAPRVIYWLSGWVPFEISVGRRILMLLTSILLFILASGLERGKRVAWLLTLVALSAAPLIHLGRMIIWPQVLFNLPLIFLLLANRRYFVARSDEKSVWSAMIVCPILLVSLLACGTMRLHDLRFETSGPDSWLGCLQAACELILVQNAYTQQPQTIQAVHFFSMLRIGGTSVALLALFLSMRPVLSLRKTTREQLEKAGRLVEDHGQDPMDAYALLTDKSFFFSTDHQVVIPYAVTGRFAVALADPIGPAHAKEQAINDFSNHCRYHDWVPLFYQTSQDLVPIYRRCDYRVVKIGEDARLETERFDLKGKHFQNLRTLCNHARKEGIRFKWYDSADGPDEILERQLGIISDQWLRRKRGVEMTFDMGCFSLEDIERFGVGVAFDAKGKPLAFTTWRPFAQGGGRVLDLMRSVPEARNVLDFVLVESILHFDAMGIHDVSLGNAPLANASGEAPSSMESRLIRFMYENLNLIYAYKPLFEFKRKYRPQWRPRYLAYPVRESLPLIGVALVRIHAPHGSWQFLKPWKA
jgi:phosphatidylglycerol lysyltransferase